MGAGRETPIAPAGTCEFTGLQVKETAPARDKPVQFAAKYQRGEQGGMHPQRQPVAFDGIYRHIANDDWFACIACCKYF